MQLSVFGIIYIIATFFFCRKKQWFTYWAVFSNTLYYSSVFTIGSFGFKPCYVNTIIMFFVFVRGDIITRNSMRNKDVSSIFLFVIWMYITFLCSFFLKDIIVVPADEEMSDYDKGFLLDVTWGSITTTIFPLFGIFSFFVTRAYIKTRQDIRDFTKGYIYSFIPLFISVCILFVLRNITHSSGILQGFFSFINPTYHRNVAGNKWGQIGDISRTFTYIGEASFTAKYYLIMLTLFASLLLYRKNTISQKAMFLGIIFIVIAMVTVLGSTTGYVGVVILIAVLIFLHIRYNHTMNVSIRRGNGNFVAFTFILGSAIIIPLCILFYQQIDFFINYLLVNHVDKLEGDAGSGVTRFNTGLVAMDAFLKSPIFGVGYGHNRTGSFFTFLLSNVGIVGFLIFNFFWLYLILVPLKKLKRMPDELKKHTMIYVTMFLISYIVNFSFASTVAIQFGWVWTNAAILSKLVKWESLKDDSYSLPAPV